MSTERKAAVWGAAFAALLASACGSGATSPSASSMSAGQWSGTTAQGASIEFTVSSDEIVKTITVGYNFNGCVGTQTFKDLSVPTALDVVCIPGPCSGPVSNYRAFSYLSGSPLRPNTSINGLFLPSARAQGLVSFSDFPGCGTAAGVQWTATRR